MDVGCGMGRNPYWYVEAGAASVLGVDMDDGSLAAARKNLATFANARVQKASAHDLDPQVHGTFDRVTCIGVLHHLAEPENALQQMWSCVAPGRRSGPVVLREGGQPADAAGDPVVPGDGLAACRSALTHAVAKAITMMAWPAIQTFPFRTDYYRRLRTLRSRTSSRSSSIRCCRTSPTTGRARTWSA